MRFRERASDHRLPTRTRFYRREANARGREQRRHFYRIRREQLFPRGGTDRALTFRRQSAAAESRTVGTRLQENRAKRRDDFTECPGKPRSYAGSLRQVRYRKRWLAFLSKERRMSSVFFGWDKYAFPSYRNNILHFNILQAGYRYRQSYRCKRASYLTVWNLEIRYDRYVMEPTSRFAKISFVEEY